MWLLIIYLSFADPSITDLPEREFEAAVDAQPYITRDVTRRFDTLEQCEAEAARWRYGERDPATLAETAGEDGWHVGIVRCAPASPPIS